MDSIVTVDYLLKLLQGIHGYGYGNMKLKCKDNYLHEDEIAIDYSNDEMKLRGYLYNFPVASKIKEFCEDIDRATKKFYEAEIGEEYEIS